MRINGGDQFSSNNNSNNGPNLLPEPEQSHTCDYNLSFLSLNTWHYFEAELS